MTVLLSFVDPDPFGYGTFWPGRIRIRNNYSDLIRHFYKNNLYAVVFLLQTQKLHSGPFFVDYIGKELHPALYCRLPAPPLDRRPA